MSLVSDVRARRLTVLREVARGPRTARDLYTSGFTSAASDLHYLKTLGLVDCSGRLWSMVGTSAASRPCDSCPGKLHPRAPTIETTCEHCQGRAEDHWEDVQTRGYL